MIGKKSCFLGAVCLALIDSAASAQNVEIFSPQSQWVLDYGEDRCRAVRVLGEGEDEIAVVFEQHRPSATLNWLIAGRYLKGVKPDEKVAIRFGGENEAFEVRFTGTEFGRFGAAIDGFGTTRTQEVAPTVVAYSSEIPSPAPAPAPLSMDVAKGEAVDWIQLDRARKDPIRLDVGNLGPVYEAMNKCVEDLIAYWGVDPEQYRRTAQIAHPKNASAVAQAMQRTYPNKAISRGEQTDLQARIMIDAQGRPTDCVISELTQAENFGDEPCRIIMRLMEFEPALDVDGIPVPSFYTFQLSYRLP